MNKSKLSRKEKIVLSILWIVPILLSLTYYIWRSSGFTLETVFVCMLITIIADIPYMIYSSKLNSRR